MRRVMAVLLCLALLFGMVPVALASPLSDVPPNHWAYEELSLLYASGLIVGFPDETFRGNEPMTRYQFAEVMGKLLNRLDAIANKGLEAANKNAAELEALKAAIKDELAASGKNIDDATAARLAEAVQKLRDEFKAEIDSRMASLEERVTALESLEEKVAALEKENAQLKSQKNLGMWGIILGVAGIATGLLVK